VASEKELGAAIAGVRAGIKIAAPVHDAFLIEADEEDLESEIGRMQVVMGWASEQICKGLRLGSDAKIVRYPDRYMDKRGLRFWNTVMGLCGLPKYEGEV
jgi:hypothetical protein